MLLVLRPGYKACRQFKMIPDIEIFDHVLVIFCELQKGVGTRGDHPTTQLQRL